jgi:hypothetical protein
VALASAAAELIWMKRLLQEMGVIFSGLVIVNEENQSCIHLLDKWEHCRLKHDVKYNFVRDMCTSSEMVVKHVSSQQQKADILTKGLTRDPFQRLTAAIGLHCMKTN